jgi:hypothetical protein
MKGIIFNLAEEVVADLYGEAVWDGLLVSAGVDGAYTSIGSYPDDELSRIFTAASTALDVPAPDLVRQLGAAAIPRLATRYPAFFDGHATTPRFLLTLNDIIHPEVRKVYPGAQVPTFGFGQGPNGEFEMSYRSARQLCTLAEGFITGAASYYGETAEIEQPSCMLAGADHCLLRCSFAPSND